LRLPWLTSRRSAKSKEQVVLQPKLLSMICDRIYVPPEDGTMDCLIASLGHPNI
jgi:hypothetical protein